jgi:hypothetical protein
MTTSERAAKRNAAKGSDILVLLVHEAPAVQCLRPLPVISHAYEAR